MIAPTHPRLAANDKDDAFEVPMVVGARLRVRLDRHGTGPQLLSADAGKIDRSFPVHAGSRRNIHPADWRGLRGPRHVSTVHPEKPGEDDEPLSWPRLRAATITG